MKNFSIIQKSQLEGAIRIDAEYYQPEYLVKTKALLKFPTARLGEIAFITDGEHGSPIFDENSGVKYFSAQHVRDCFVDGLEAKTISKIIDNKNRRSRLKTGDILLSTVGTIGFAGLITDDLLPANIDRHVARIALNEKTLEPEFLVAFLNSSFGKFQSIREATGNVQLNIFIDKIKEFLVPKNNNLEIAEMVRVALKELNNSRLFYQQTENLLLEELGLKEFGNEEKLSSIVNFSEIESVCRIDAEYFQPKYNIILEKTRKNNGKKLGDLVSMKKGIEVGAEEYQDEGKIFIRVSSMTKFGIVESDQKCLSDKLYESLKKDFEPKKGEILLTKDATLGIAYVLKEDIQSIISGGTLRLKIKDDSVDGEYLALCLNSIIGQMQAERDAGGSVIAHWKPEQIKNVIIPVLPKEIQLKISELVQKSHIARKKSKELLEDAKKKVEEMIEFA